MIILASTSAYRRGLLERLGLPFECVAPEVPEDDLPGETPRDRARRLAVAKAQAVARKYPGSIVIGSDQVASLETPAGPLVLHKPGDRERCRTQLQQMSGKVVDFDTAVCVSGPAGVRSHVDRTRVKFRPLGATQIESYMDREPAFECAGGFKCEGLGVTLFEQIDSRDPTALVGLPLIWLCEALREAGVAV